MPEDRMDENTTDELRKLGSIATDMQLSSKMRVQAINQLGEMASHESLLVLLNLVASSVEESSRISFGVMMGGGGRGRAGPRGSRLRGR